MLRGIRAVMGEAEGLLVGELGVHWVIFFLALLWRTLLYPRNTWYLP